MSMAPPSKKEVDFTPRCFDEIIESTNSSKINPSPPTETYEFEWTPSQQMNLIGFYYFGYVPCHLLGGSLAFKYGFKRVLMVSALGAAFLSAFFPVMARSSYWLAVANRVVLGVLQTGWFPAMQGAWGHWAPENEKSTLIMIPFAGAGIGSVTTLMGGGFISKLFGWEWMFYVPAVLSFTWALLWSFCVYDTPAEHPRITKEELRLLPQSDLQSRKKQSIPFRNIFRSKEIWAFVLAQIGTNYQFFMVTTLFPQLMKNLLGLDGSLAGLISGLSILVHILAILILAVVCDKLAVKIGLLKIRKYFIVLGFFVMPLTLALAHKDIIGCSASAAFWALTLNTTMMGFQAVSVKSNPNDLAPTLAGIINGLANVVANTTGFWGPAIAGIFFDRFGHSEISYNYLFLIGIGINYFTGISFITMFSVEEQPWSKKNQEKEVKNELLDSSGSYKTSSSDGDSRKETIESM